MPKRSISANLLFRGGDQPNPEFPLEKDLNEVQGASKRTVF